VGILLIDKFQSKQNMRLSFLLFFALFFLQAKTQCTVSIAALVGQYTGDCKNGKANGYGKATGEDSYEGNFKNGVPDGEGKYTWKDGRVYIGNWIKGVQDGKGILLIKKETKEDTLMQGFWKKGEYVGKTAAGFIIHTRTKQITNISVRKVNKLVNEIYLTLESVSGNEVNGFNVSQTMIDKPTISSMQMAYGDFAKRTVEDQLLKKTAYRFEGVTYPFRTIINIGTEMFEIEIFEPANWLIEVKIAN
jgi:hypothetical protein